MRGLVIIIIIIIIISANVKVQNIFHRRNDITCSTNCKYRTAATLYALDKCFFFGKIIVNTVHKVITRMMMMMIIIIAVLAKSIPLSFN
jgi:hypothetical protein